MLIAEIGLPQLFDQLGLDSSNLAIARFIKHHPLSGDVILGDANFWSESQRQFIKDSWRSDSDWCEVVDKLDALLRHSRRQAAEQIQ